MKPPPPFPPPLACACSLVWPPPAGLPGAAAAKPASKPPREPSTISSAASACGGASERACGVSVPGFKRRGCATTLLPLIHLRTDYAVLQRRPSKSFWAAAHERSCALCTTAQSPSPARPPQSCWAQTRGGPARPAASRRARASRTCTTATTTGQPSPAQLSIECGWMHAGGGRAPRARSTSRPASAWLGRAVAAQRTA